MLNRGEREDYDPRRFEVVRREPPGDKYAFGRRGGRDDEMDTDPRMRLRLVQWSMSMHLNATGLCYFFCRQIIFFNKIAERTCPFKSIYCHVRYLHCYTITLNG